MRILRTWLMQSSCLLSFLNGCSILRVDCRGVLDAHPALHTERGDEGEVKRRADGAEENAE